MLTTRRLLNSWQGTSYSWVLTLNRTARLQFLIRDWLKTNWSSYVGVSFLPVTNSTYEYLPQEVVTEQRYKEYVAQLTEVDFGGTDSALEMQNDECESGVCPVK